MTPICGRHYEELVMSLYLDAARGIVLRREMIESYDEGSMKRTKLMYDLISSLDEIAGIFGVKPLDSAFFNSCTYS